MRGILKLTLRIDLGRAGAIGPGKIRLLEAVRAEGSISGGARALGMSYRRAWLLIDSMNRVFGRPVVRANPGGAKGGGAKLTPLGSGLIRHYRAIEAKAARAAAAELGAIAAAVDGKKPQRISRRTTSRTSRAP